MAYQVDYTNGEGKTTEAPKKHPFRAVLICFLLFLILVQLFWPNGRDAIQKLLLPGATETVWAAVDGFADQVRTGEPVGEALQSFCRSVFESACILR